MSKVITLFYVCISFGALYEAYSSILTFQSALYSLSHRPGTLTIVKPVVIVKNP